jgi:hypothetical protein
MVRSVNVSVQSLRDTLALGYGSSIGPNFKVPLPVFVPLSALQTEIGKVLDKDHRFYPCGDDCDSRARRIYLEMPELDLVGAWVILKMHLSGHVVIIPFLSEPGVTGDVLLHGVPIVHNDMLSVQGLQLEITSRNFLVNSVSPALVPRVEQRLQEKARINLRPILIKEIEKAQKNFPIRWGPACLMLDLKEITLASLVPQQLPEKGLIANFEVFITSGDSSKCASS